MTTAKRLSEMDTTELMRRDAIIGQALDSIELSRPRGEKGGSLTANLWLVQRREVRAELDRRHAAR